MHRGDPLPLLRLLPVHCHSPSFLPSFLPSFPLKTCPRALLRGGRWGRICRQNTVRRCSWRALESRSPIPLKFPQCPPSNAYSPSHTVLYSTLSLKGNWKNNPFKRGCFILWRAKQRHFPQPSGKGRKFNYLSSVLHDEEACFFDVGGRNDECEWYLFCHFRQSGGGVSL